MTEVLDDPQRIFDAIDAKASTLEGEERDAFFETLLDGIANRRDGIDMPATPEEEPASPGAAPDPADGKTSTEMPVGDPSASGGADDEKAAAPKPPDVS